MWIRVAFMCLLTAVHPAWADGNNNKTLNSVVQTVVQDFRATREGGGYDLHSAFTRDLKYGGNCCIKSSNAALTMCVAAVSEMIIETLNRQSDVTAFQKLPMSSWTGGSITTARANIFQYAGTGSRGTGHALQLLGLGREKHFSELKPYDFINFNRNNKSGHAAVFLGYLQPDSSVTLQYSDGVIGFAYFSAQGKGKADAGFADRYAYFDGKCPAQAAALPRDCGVLRSSNLVLLSGGELWTPDNWTTDARLKQITASIRSVLERRYPGATKGLIGTQLQTELSRELQPDSDSFTGETTD